jgi:hypothetical protein
MWKVGFLETDPNDHMDFVVVRYLAATKMVCRATADFVFKVSHM